MPLSARSASGYTAHSDKSANFPYQLGGVRPRSHTVGVLTQHHRIDNAGFVRQAIDMTHDGDDRPATQSMPRGTCSRL